METINFNSPESVAACIRHSISQEVLDRMTTENKRPADPDSIIINILVDYRNWIIATHQGEIIKSVSKSIANFLGEEILPKIITNNLPPVATPFYQRTVI